eukprot:gene19403-21326_t
MDNLSYNFKKFLFSNREVTKSRGRTGRERSRQVSSREGRQFREKRSLSPFEELGFDDERVSNNENFHDIAQKAEETNQLNPDASNQPIKKDESTLDLLDYSGFEKVDLFAIGLNRSSIPDVGDCVVVDNLTGGVKVVDDKGEEVVNGGVKNEDGFIGHCSCRSNVISEESDEDGKYNVVCHIHAYNANASSCDTNETDADANNEDAKFPHSPSLSSSLRRTSFPSDFPTDDIAHTSESNHQRPKAERHKPLGREQFEKYFDNDGRVVGEHDLRRSIFKGGVDEDIRREVWQFLYELYPCNSTKREREILKTEHQIRYQALKERWRPILRKIASDDPMSVKFCPDWFRKRKHNEPSISEKEESIKDGSVSTGLDCDPRLTDHVQIDGLEGSAFVGSTSGNSESFCKVVNLISNSVEPGRDLILDSTIREDNIECLTEQFDNLISDLDDPSAIKSLQRIQSQAVDLPEMDLFIDPESDSNPKCDRSPDSPGSNLEAVEQFDPLNPVSLGYEPVKDESFKVDSVVTRADIEPRTDQLDSRPHLVYHSKDHCEGAIRVAISEAMLESEPPIKEPSGSHVTCSIDGSNCANENASTSEGSSMKKERKRWKSAKKRKREEGEKVHEEGRRKEDDKVDEEDERQKEEDKVDEEDEKVDVEARRKEDDKVDEEERIRLEEGEVDEEVVTNDLKEKGESSEEDYLCEDDSEEVISEMEGNQNHVSYTREDCEDDVLRLQKKIGVEEDVREDVEEGVDENVDEDVEEGLDENVDEDVEEGVDEDVKDVEEDVDENVDEDVDEDVIENVNEIVDEDVREGVEGVDEDVEEGVDEDVGEDVDEDSMQASLSIVGDHTSIISDLNSIVQDSTNLCVESSPELDSRDLVIRESNVIRLNSNQSDAKLDSNSSDSNDLADLSNPDLILNESGLLLDNKDSLVALDVDNPTNNNPNLDLRPKESNFRSKEDDEKQHNFYSVDHDTSLRTVTSQHVDARTNEGRDLLRLNLVKSPNTQMNGDSTKRESPSSQPDTKSMPPWLAQQITASSPAGTKIKKTLRVHAEGLSLLEEESSHVLPLREITEKASLAVKRRLIEAEMEQQQLMVRSSTPVMDSEDGGEGERDGGSSRNDENCHNFEDEGSCLEKIDDENLKKLEIFSNVTFLKYEKTCLSFRTRMIPQTEAAIRKNSITASDQKISQASGDSRRNSRNLTSPLLSISEDGHLMCPYCGIESQDAIEVPEGFGEDWKRSVEIQAKVYAGRQVYNDTAVCRALRIIDKDVPRTDRELSYFKGNDNIHLLKLRDALISYAFFHPDVGYAQGMNDIMSRFFVVMDSEADAYWMFCNYMEHFKEDFMETDMLRKINLVEQLLMKMDRELFDFLQQFQMELIFCHRWLLLSFKREFSYKDGLRVFEIMSSRHLEVSSFEAEMERSRERARELENNEGSRLEEIDVMPEFSFDVFMCVAMLSECREALMQTEDIASIYQTISSLPQVNDLNTILSKAEDLFYQYCRKSTMDCFQLIDEPVHQATSWRQRFHLTF